MFTRKLILVLCLTAGGALALEAQTQTVQPAAPQKTPSAPPAAPSNAAAAPSTVDGGEPHWIKPETAEQRKLRLGLNEDPGPDPDPTKKWFRYGHMYTIGKNDRRWVNYDNPPAEGFVRPFGFINIYHEMYQQNEKWVWTWDPVRDDPSNQQPVEEEAPPQSQYTAEQLEYLQRVRSEFAPLAPASSDVTVHFKESSDGLPSSGSWRNSLTVADMNGDGCPDIVAPPERGVPNGSPSIFLGDCKGHWTFWKDVKWPRTLDYGSVVAADFNKDGKMDLAFGVHLTGVFVFLGDGKGNFTDASDGLSADFPSRRIVVTDVDHDGYPDIVALSEGPTPRDEALKTTKYGKLRVYYNRQKGTKWEGENIATPDQYFGGDWLSTGNFNDDKYPDFIGASVFYNGPNILYVSDGPKKFKLVGGYGKLIPYYSYHYANAAGHFSSKKLDDAIISYVRVWPDTIDPKIVPPPATTPIVGIDRITFSGSEPVRTPVIRWASGRGIWGMAAGDLDGDGNTDIIYTRAEPRGIDILLGDGKGGFRKAAIDGMRLELNTNYDVKLADVNGDGRLDLILAYESSGGSMLSQRDGSIHVYLNMGATHAAAAPAKVDAGTAGEPQGKKQ